MKDYEFDAIVVGSGISGGWAAKELCELGLKVLMLERGRPIKHQEDYVNENKEIYEFAHRGLPTMQMKANSPVLARTSYLFTEETDGMWANEKESPYTEVKPFNWYRAYQLGGRSLLWGRQCYRLNRFDFEANAKEGVGVDWPIRYDDLAPWYAYVEKFAGIQGSKQGLEILPDGEFLPAMQMNVVEQALAQRLQHQYGGARHLFIGRSANLTQPHHGRVNCQFRNNCWRGCSFGAYFSTQSATLPAAMQTGNLTVQTHKIATHLTYDKATRKASGVEVIDALDHTTTAYTAKIVFVCASTFNSTWLLMNSATDVWDEGLGSSSGALGRNVMDHPADVGAYGTVEGFSDKYEFGRRPTGVYLPRYRNVYGDRRTYLRGFGYQGEASRGRRSDVPRQLVGKLLKTAMTAPADNWQMVLDGFGEMLPDPRNRIYLDKSKRDKWGLPVLAMNAQLRENERAMRKEMQADAAEMLHALGLKNVGSYDSEYTVGQTIHEMGTARMGRDPKTSVLNGHNQVWDAPNVFVTDGACMTSSSCVNPSLTYMALTARAAHFAVEELKASRL